MGQLTLWDASELIRNDLSVISETLAKSGKFWLANIISISEGRSYFVTDSPKVQGWLSSLTGVAFVGHTCITNRLWLRKEVLIADEANA